MPTNVKKIDSNVTGLLYAEEDPTNGLGVLGHLPGAGADPPTANTGVWRTLEPNSYSDFGGSLTTIARNPINPSRQRKKGVVADLDSAGGFNTDLTQSNIQDLLQGVFFADLIRRGDWGFYLAQKCTDVATGTNIYTVDTGGPVLLAGHLIFCSGFTNAANNGLKRVTAGGATTITVVENLANENPTANTAATIAVVGFQFDAGDFTSVASGGVFPTYGTTAEDFTVLGLMAGEWIHVGGDSAAEQFTGSALNNGWKRIRAVTATTLTIDKSVTQMTADDAGGAKTIRVFFGRVLKNQTGTAVKRRSYTLERRLGVPDTAQPTLVQAEYIRGAVTNEFTLTIPTAEKINCDFTFVGTKMNTHTATAASGNGALWSQQTGALTPALVEADAFNTSSDFSRIKLSTYSATDEALTPLFAYATEITLSFNNNVTPNKAVGVLGSFDSSAGTFEVGGNITAYFQDVAGVASVQSNADITLDLLIVKANAGIAIDLPLITLGDGRPNVEQDQAVTLPFEIVAATGAKISSAMDHTALMCFFDYLPTLAEL